MTSFGSNTTLWLGHRTNRSIRTERAYVDWIKRYILFHDKRHLQEMGRQEIEAFLTHLAVEQNVAASTQNQALSALLFLYRCDQKTRTRATFVAMRGFG